LCSTFGTTHFGGGNGGGGGGVEVEVVVEVVVEVEVVLVVEVAAGPYRVRNAVLVWSRCGLVLHSAQARQAHRLEKFLLRPSQASARKGKP
jgi:hypothetical protein